MNKRIFYIAPTTEALRYASLFLQENGYDVVAVPSNDVTHLILPIPSVQPDGNLVGRSNISAILDVLPKTVTIIGGNLPAWIQKEYHTLDLLQHEGYLARNAAITAECAVRIAAKELPRSLTGCQILILGWGRIGKCLSNLLYNAGAEVTVAARNTADRAMAEALGYTTSDYHSLSNDLHNYRIIFNTVPFMVLSDTQASSCRSDCLKIDLASMPGIGGSGVIWARGLPGKMMPEASGLLIAKTVLENSISKEDTL